MHVEVALHDLLALLIRHQPPHDRHSQHVLWQCAGRELAGLALRLLLVLLAPATYCARCTLLLLLLVLRSLIVLVLVLIVTERSLRLGIPIRAVLIVLLVVALGPVALDLKLVQQLPLPDFFIGQLADTFPLVLMTTRPSPLVVVVVVIKYGKQLILSTPCHSLPFSSVVLAFVVTSLVMVYR